MGYEPLYHDLQTRQAYARFSGPFYFYCNLVFYILGAFLIKQLFVTSSNVLRKGSLQTKLNAGLSEQQEEDLFQNERSFHEVKL